MTTTMSNTIERISLAAIRPSPINYRRTINPDTVAELAESIARDNLMQPVLVRPLPFDPQADAWVKYEIVFGHRRFAAVQLLGHEHINCMIKDMSDEQACRAQLAENMQREDPNAIDEALGLQRLISEHHVQPDALAEQIGKSRSYIYNRLRLLKLRGEARKAVEAGTLGADTAALIAALPLVLHDNALAAVTAGPGSYLPYRACKRLLTNMMTPLQQATFDPADSTYPDHIACTSCTRLSHNDPGLAGDVDPDVCTDRRCFEQKTRAHGGRVIQLAREAGQRVALDSEQAQYFLSNGQLRDGFIDASKLMHHWHPGGMTAGAQTTWLDLITEIRTAGELASDPIQVQNPADGVVAQLISREDRTGLLGTYSAILSRRHAQAAASAGDNADDEPADTAPVAAWPAARPRSTSWRATATPEQVAVMDHWPAIRRHVIVQACKAERSTDDLRLIVSTMVPETLEYESELLAACMGWTDLLDTDVDDQVAAILAKLPSLTADELTRLMMLAAIVASSNMDVNRTHVEDADHRLGLAARWGAVDVLQIARQQQAEDEAEDHDDEVAA